MPIKALRGSGCCVQEADDDDFVEVNIPTDADTALSVDLDDEVTITIKGKVKRVHATKGEDVWGTPGDIAVQVEDITVDGKNAFESLID